MKTKLFSLCFVLLTSMSVCADDATPFLYSTLNHVLASMSVCADDATTSDNGSTTSQETELSPAPANVQAVDLGLPSGVKWASCNVGAENPKECGYCYAWGEVLPTENYSRAKIAKYHSDTCYVGKDNTKTLEPNDDAAHVNWGGIWRMPTSSEWQELFRRCYLEKINNNDSIGYLFKSKRNGNTIFLPVYISGYWSASIENGTTGSVLYAKYWDQDGAFSINSREGEFRQRLLVRPVYTDTTAKRKKAELRPAPANVQAVDLGLPSGVKWASCNVGAENPEDFGNYYAWGEVLPKEDYSLETYKYADGSYDALTKYCSDASYGVKDNKKTLTPNDDAAHVNWGGKWRMPTLAEWEELCNDKYCRMIVTTQKGIVGILIKSRINGNSIFLPYAGYLDGTDLEQGVGGCSYWTTRCSIDYPYKATSYKTALGCFPLCAIDLWRCYGLPIRPVCK